MAEEDLSASPRRWWVLVAIGIGTFMSALDGSVVNTVLPVLRQQFHTQVSTIEWVATIYLLVVSALLLGVGRLGDLRGQKRMYLSGFVLFVLGSAACGASASVHMLIAMRGLQAIGAAMLFANAPAILTRSFSAAERGRALGAQATFTYLGLTAGPALGGWLAHLLGWRSVFYINLPVGLVGIAVGWRVIADDRPAHKSEKFDIAGAALFATGLTLLLLALSEGAEWGWASLRTLGLAAVAVVILALFVRAERRWESPMLDLSLFGNRTFTTSTLTALLNYICVYSVVFVLPFLLIQARGLDTQHAGIVLTAQPIVMAVIAPMSGAWSDRIGSRSLSTAGMVILSGGLVLLGMLSAEGSLVAIAAGLAIVGLGVGLFVSPNNSALMGSAPRHRQGIAAGVLATARNVGMVLGIGVAGAVLSTFLVRGGGATRSASLVAGVRAALFVSGGIAAAGALSAFLGGNERLRAAGATL